MKLGAFELLEPLGKGGMSEVWRGAHTSGTAVAIKILSAKQKPELARALFTEVRAVAALHHPGIVMLLDHGIVNDTPYLVMELASGGTLGRIKRALPFPELRATLLVLLDALAHAHARGVVHRDLKPSNILIAGKKDLRPGLKIADFGLAFAAEAHRKEKHDRRAGTLSYMAPEQIAGAWRDYGPWTDLFSLGCIAYQLASAKRPWPAGAEDLEARARVLESPPAPLDAAHEAPDAFEKWIERMLERDPAKRFRCAADAAFQLVKLGGVSEADTLHATTEMVRVAELPDEATNPDPEDAGALIDTSSFLESQLVTFSVVEQDVTEPDAQIFSAVAASSGPQNFAPPIPPTWRAVRTDPAPLQLVGAGLSLYPLRAIPFVDRTKERDAIWSALRDAKASGHTRVVIMRGAAGSGKSRLAEWTSERASELGSAIVLKATHSPFPTPSDGLGPMLARHLRCVELERPQMLRRAETIVRAQGATLAYEWDALAELMSPRSEQTEPTIRFAQPADRYEVLRRFLARTSEERPAIVWIEDAQWASDALSFALHLVNAAEPTRALVLITQRDEALAERLVEAALIEKLVRSPASTALDIGPLGADDHRALVQQMLPFEGELAKEIAARTAGNPLFASQLVGDWVQRGILETGPRGFRIRDGERAVLPDDVHQVWADRIARLVAGAGEHARHALELAAVLGQRVDLGEWREACAQADLTVPSDRLMILTNELVAGCLAKGVDHGFTFVHAMVRESLVRAAAEAKRLHLHHRAVADMLIAREENAERIAEHLIAGQQPERAIGPLLAAARRRFEASELNEALALLERRERLLETTNAPETDVRWGEGWILRAELLQQLGAIEDSEQWAVRAEAAATQFGWVALMPGALFVRAQALQSRSDLAAAQLLYELAIPICESRNDQRGHASCLRELAFCKQQRGALREAEEDLRRARSLFGSIDDLLGVAATVQRLGLVARQRGDLLRSESLFELALKTFERAGNAYGVASCKNGLGDTARFVLKLQLAQRRYEESAAMYEAIGAVAAALVPRLNLVCLALSRGAIEEGRRLAEETIEPIERFKRRALLAAAYLYTLPALASDAAWDRFDDRFSEVRSILEETKLIEADIAWPAQLAGDLALSRGQHERARASYELSLEQWSALGKVSEAKQVEEILARF